jgi:hypothetical protein
MMQRHSSKLIEYQGVSKMHGINNLEQFNDALERWDSSVSNGGISLAENISRIPKSESW